VHCLEQAGLLGCRWPTPAYTTPRDRMKDAKGMHEQHDTRTHFEMLTSCP
jgi:hypothetical protein